jgi:hypothetical protein
LAEVEAEVVALAIGLVMLAVLAVAVAVFQNIYLEQKTLASLELLFQ